MNWSYLFKHWFGTLLIGPFVSQIIMYIYQVSPHKIVGLLEVYPISLVFSLFFSTPTYLLYSILYWFLGQKNINPKTAKIILISFTVYGVYITTKIIKGSMMDDVVISYSISSILIGLLLKLNFKKNDNHKPNH